MDHCMMAMGRNNLADIQTAYPIDNRAKRLIPPAWKLDPGFRAFQGAIDARRYWPVERGRAMRIMFFALGIGVALQGGIGCGESTAPKNEPRGTKGSGSPSAVDLAPPPAGTGVQLEMASELGPGVEVERCKFFTVPPDGLYVNREDIRFTAGSHHVLLYQTPYTSIPTEDRFGDQVDTSSIFDCGKLGPTAHWEVNGILGGSQVAEGSSIVEHLPEDTAVRFPGGTIMLMNTHYLNASSQTIQTDARINLYTVPAAQVKREAGFLFFYNPFIRVPAQGNAEAREVCAVPSDEFLVNAQSHMHRRGVGYRAVLLEADGSQGDELYSGTDWEDVVKRNFEPPKLLKAGERIDYRCEYDNREDRVVTQGLSTKDEMCMLLGLYFPKNRQFELCGLDDTWAGGFMGAQWIGSGAASGRETVDCLLGAEDPDKDKGDSFFGCVVQSCPRISQPMSDAARCLYTKGLGKCSTACEASGDGCSACYRPICQESVDTLALAQCSG
jgi:hypothetical protein